MVVSRKLWSTERINVYNINYNEGINLDDLGESPYYEGKFGWRKGNQLFDYSDLEKDEIKKCKRDILYFADRYAFAMTDEGIAKINLRDYQREVLREFQNNRFSILLASRQIGKTILASIFIAWYSTFHYDRNILIVSNKYDGANEIIDKVKQVVLHLPYFLKPGVSNIAVKGMSFDNGCRIRSSATTPTAGIGYTNHLVYADEFAYVHNNIAEKFFKSIFPTLVSSKISRMIITSTPNNKNLFYRIYNSALNKLNGFRALRVDWWQVPGRDERWKQSQIADLGSEDIFNQEYGNSFESSGNSLASGDVLRFFSRIQSTYEHVNIDILDNPLYENAYKHLTWHPELFEELDDDDKFVLSVDLGSGVGGDYTVINIFKVVRMNYPKIYNYTYLANGENDYFTLKQVGIFRDNLTDNEEVAFLTAALISDYLFPENSLIVVEMNHRGAEFIKDIEKYKPDLLDNDIFFRGISRKNKKYNQMETGVYVSKTKVDECKVLLKNWKNRRIVVTEENTYIECAGFGLNEKGFYEGLGVHDDTVMTMVNLGNVFNSSQFIWLVEDEIQQFSNDEIEIMDI